MTFTDQPTVRPPPWWRHGHVWLVVSGPAIVVVASLVTGFIAARGADPVVQDHAAARDVAITRQARAERALLPAMQARNHAATPPAPAR